MIKANVASYTATFRRFAICLLGCLATVISTAVDDIRISAHLKDKVSVSISFH